MTLRPVRANEDAIERSTPKPPPRPSIDVLGFGARFGQVDAATRVELAFGASSELTAADIANLAKLATPKQAAKSMRIAGIAPARYERMPGQKGRGFAVYPRAAVEAWVEQRKSNGSVPRIAAKAAGRAPTTSERIEAGSARATAELLRAKRDALAPELEARRHALAAIEAAVARLDAAIECVEAL